MRRRVSSLYLIKIAQKRDEMSYTYHLMIHIGLTTRYLLLMESATRKTTAGSPILAVRNPMMVKERMTARGAVTGVGF